MRTHTAQELALRVRVLGIELGAQVTTAPTRRHQDSKHSPRPDSGGTTYSLPSTARSDP